MRSSSVLTVVAVVALAGVGSTASSAGVAEASAPPAVSAREAADIALEELFVSLFDESPDASTRTRGATWPDEPCPLTGGTTLDELADRTADDLGSTGFAVDTEAGPQITCSTGGDGAAPLSLTVSAIRERSAAEFVARSTAHTDVNGQPARPLPRPVEIDGLDPAATLEVTNDSTALAMWVGDGFAVTVSRGDVDDPDAAAVQVQTMLPAAVDVVFTTLDVERPVPVPTSDRRASFDASMVEALTVGDPTAMAVQQLDGECPVVDVAGLQPSAPDPDPFEHPDSVMMRAPVGNISFTCAFGEMPQRVTIVVEQVRALDAAGAVRRTNARDDRSAATVDADAAGLDGGELLIDSRGDDVLSARWVADGMSIGVMVVDSREPADTATHVAWLTAVVPAVLAHLGVD